MSESCDHQTVNTVPVDRKYAAVEEHLLAALKALRPKVICAKCGENMTREAWHAHDRMASLRGDPVGYETPVGPAVEIDGRRVCAYCHMHMDRNQWQCANPLCPGGPPTNPPVGDETEALRKDETDWLSAMPVWSNFDPPVGGASIREKYDRLVARVAGLEAREAALRELVDAARAVLDYEHTPRRAALSDLREALSALADSGEAGS